MFANYNTLVLTFLIFSFMDDLVQLPITQPPNLFVHLLLWNTFFQVPLHVIPSGLLTSCPYPKSSYSSCGEKTSEVSPYCGVRPHSDEDRLQFVAVFTKLTDSAHFWLSQSVIATHQPKCRLNTPHGACLFIFFTLMKRCNLSCICTQMTSSVARPLLGGVKRAKTEGGLIVAVSD